MRAALCFVALLISTCAAAPAPAIAAPPRHVTTPCERACSRLAACDYGPVSSCMSMCGDWQARGPQGPAAFDLCVKRLSCDAIRQSTMMDQGPAGLCISEALAANPR